MNNEQRIELNEAIAELPVDIQFSIQETPWEYACEDIQKELTLSNEVYQKLLIEVGMLLSSVIDIKEFILEIKNIPKLDEKTSSEILTLVSERIMTPFLLKIKENRGEIQRLIEQYDTDINELSAEILESDGSIADFVPKKLLAIPIKKKPSSEPVITMRNEQESNTTIRPSTYTATPDPYHESLE